MARPERVRVLRTDGKPIHLIAKRAHLMVCARGCCCGHTERGHAEVPVDFYKDEYKRRGLRRRVQLTMSGCLGPCPVANVVLLVCDGRPLWFQSINSRPLIAALFDYLQQLLAADRYLPPPPGLAEHVFPFYTWTHPPGAAPVAAMPAAPADGFLLLTHADTDLLTLHHALPLLPADFPPVRALSLGRLGTEEHLAAALAGPLPRVVLARILGGAGSVPGLRRLVEAVRSRGRHLLVLSGTGLDPDLTALSTVTPAVVHEAAAYLQAGGRANLAHLLRCLADHLLLTGFGYEGPAPEPAHGLYHPDLPGRATLADWLARRDPARPTAGLLFYRAHWMSGNLAFIDMLVRRLEAQGLNVLPVFTASLKEPSAAPARPTERWPAAFDLLLNHPPGERVPFGERRGVSPPVAAPHRLPDAAPLALRTSSGGPLIDVLISTVSFALGEVNPDGPTLAGPAVGALAALDVPVLQAVCAGTPRWQWESSPRGLNPLDTAMNVALPEFDGRLITVPVSFKEPVGRSAGAEVVHYVPAVDRIDRVAGLAARLAALRHKPNSAKRVAFILTNAAGKAARVGNAVGLDAPASLLRVLAALGKAGYSIGDLPADGDTLIHDLLDRCCYDETFLTDEQLARAAARVPAQQYQRWFEELPEVQRRQMTKQWGEPPGQAFVHDGHVCLAGLELGNVFVALQPPRGYGMDPAAIYHQPDLPPPHHYYALYRWLREVWDADAIVHLGKHGTLEWLPGKGVGLSGDCYPDTFLADLPLFYPFILNDPGEGAQAKRRAHAVVVDHLTPPLTTADAHGELAELMQLVDEYYQVEALDPAKGPILARQIWDLIRQAHLEDDLKYLMQQGHGDHTHEWDEGLTAEGAPVGLAGLRGREVSHLVGELDGYLCELAGAQIRDGLHVLGCVPQGEQMVDLLGALTRVPNLEVPSLRGAVAGLLGLDLDALLREPGRPLALIPPMLAELADRRLASHADALETVDEVGGHLLALLERRGFDAGAIEAVLAETFPKRRCGNNDLRAVLHFVCARLVPALRQSTDEIANLLAALAGRYVPAGPSGAPTRGMAHVLPTGRNFYAVDPRALPSAAAWQVGQELARALIERYRSETGAYPETVGISAWGTSAMRTHGDDVAEVLALWGVRPVWQKENRRTVGVEVIPLPELGRPRIDVTVRISGFFRDAFPHLVALLDQAVQAVLGRDEPPEQNYVRKHYLADLAAGVLAGAACYRIFGSKPGCYGAGILPLIDERNWREDADFAEAYVNWGGYAYGAEAQGADAREVFRRRLAGVQLALHNQDNREHDIFDSDDYFQFHGGMIATVRALTGRRPRCYFGDTHDPARPAVRDLQQEVLRVFRTRVTNPKWLEGVRRHGYKGGLELAATVDYLFGYDATAGVVADWMYEQVAQVYALAAEQREFLARSNPWALAALAERLLEAAQRGLWAEPSADTLAALRATLLEGEALLEARGERSDPWTTPSQRWSGRTC
jgi:cobaltochelatase CobN